MDDADTLTAGLVADSIADARRWAEDLWHGRKPDLSGFDERFALALWLAMAQGATEPGEGNRGLYWLDGVQRHTDALGEWFASDSPAFITVFTEMLSRLKKKGPRLAVIVRRDVPYQVKQTAWYVTGVIKGKILDELKQKLVNSKARGGTLQDYIQSCSQLETDHESVLDARRLETVYRTNCAGAAEAGRRRQMEDPDVADLFFGYRYKAMGDARTRPLHALFNGFIARKEDPVWRIVFPPCGFNCRCHCRGVRRHQAVEAGLIDANGRYVTDQLFANRAQEQIYNAALSNTPIEIDGKRHWFPDEGFRGNALASVG